MEHCSFVVVQLYELFAFNYSHAYILQAVYKNPKNSDKKILFQIPKSPSGIEKLKCKMS